MIMTSEELRSDHPRLSGLLLGASSKPVSRWDRLALPTKPLRVASRPLGAIEPTGLALPSGLLAEIEGFVGTLTTRQARLLEYWNHMRGDRAMPARRDLNPAEMRSLLPNLVLIDVAEGCTDFRFRLMGTAVVAQCFRDYTGKLFSELEGYGPRGYGWNNHLKAVTHQRPRIGNLPYTGPYASIIAHHNLTLPLSSDGRRVDMILCISEFERQTSDGIELV